MSMFRAKKLDLGCFVNVKIIRDHTKRKVFEEFEPQRQALRYIVRNTALPVRTRAEAQLQLTQMHCYTRPTQIRNRCVMGGKGRGVLRDFKLSRYNFRMQALEGNIPGVKKAIYRSALLDLFRPLLLTHITFRYLILGFLPLIFFGGIVIMFRRRWSGLPADPVYPADLTELGYFVNGDDEIRSIEDPKKYFKYFITKNDRWNERQRFALKEAIERLIHARLEGLGLEKLRLPLGARPADRHIPIFASADLATADRIVVIFGEPAQDLGILAQRVASGPGGLDRGSMVSVVRSAMTIMAGAGADEGEDGRGKGKGETRPGIVLANTGQLWWWPEGGRPLTHAGRHAMPMASAVHWGRADGGPRNEVAGNETVGAHVRCVFETVVRGLAAPRARIHVVAVGDAADEVEAYLDGEEAWREWGPRMECLALLGGFYKAADLKCEGFKRFMRERARAYVIHDDPLDFPISGPDGNPKEVAFTEFGCPVYSAGPDASLVELLLIHTHPAVLGWTREVARAGAGYKNPHIEVAAARGAEEEGENALAADGWGGGLDGTPVEEGGTWESLASSSSNTGEAAAVEKRRPSVGEGTCAGGALKQNDGTGVEAAAAGNGQMAATASERAAETDGARDDGVPAHKAEVLALLSSMEKFATQRLDEAGGEERDDGVVDEGY
ncbi:hypothetical protein QBC33DRAFT_518533 [Phialemonium atrogriseum]|uniref:Arb2 domain-containing protein n=1 Tax=Phialemonium atrogriseum TaxID=1093897 RepID=A0AAJ0BSS8_9PEZI|nr:uncharacterized protein QBC33DRAFT_518533 [Phialemonium atrogriseum]KAK1763591.1 hypothetical protein QBC33DRAFT_518533 [Phialemonium atrogriseum]